MPRANATLILGVALGLLTLNALRVYLKPIPDSPDNHHGIAPRAANKLDPKNYFATPTQLPQDVGHDGGGYHPDLSSDPDALPRPSARLKTGAEVEKCKMKWTETIKDKYSLLVPMHGHVNYSAYFEHYGASSKVDRIVIAWANKGEQPPDWSRYPKVCTVVQETDSLVTRSEGALPIDYGLNNRFRPYACIRTEAVFSVDNDMLIPTNYMDFVFDTWRMFPRHIVGYAIRIAKKSIEEQWEGLYEIHWPGYSAGHVPGHKLEYNLVFTNAAIFHRELLNDYTCTMPQEIRDMVTKIRSCEDIAMNVLSYAKWGAQPLGMTTQMQCVDNYGVGPKFKRDEGGLAKKGDMDTYALFRGKCYRKICEWLDTWIPTMTITAKPYNDRMMCPPGSKKPGQF